MTSNIVMLADTAEAGDPAVSALKRAGYEVHILTFANMDPATIVRFKPQAVVFDVGRQSANAYEFLAELRKSPNLKDAVMIGVFGGKESSEDRRAEDFDHRLRKPVDLKALLSAIASPPQATYRALLAEDHRGLAEATAFLMRREGLEVWIAATGRDALEIAARVHLEIVLCDLNLPDMSGIDVARKLRAIAGTKDALIAIHTIMSEVNPDIHRHPTDESINLIVPKPLTPEKVAALVSEVRAMRQLASRESRRKH